MNNYRREVKFLIEGLHSHIARSYILASPYSFLKEYSDRFVNNIYFDTINLKNFYDNVDGNTNRIKIRLRWYGEILKTINKSTVEIKKKRNQLGSKDLYPIKHTLNIEKQPWSPMINLIKKTMKDDYYKFMNSLCPILINQYKREYYKSKCGDLRLTLDTNVKYFCQSSSNVINTQHQAVSIPYSILELKYLPIKQDKAIDTISQIPFPVTKSSKYVTGLNLLNTQYLYINS